MQGNLSKEDPATLQTAILLNIQRRLVALEKLAEEEIPKGKTHPYRRTINRATIYIEVAKDIKSKAFSVSIINDGPSALYKGINDFPDKINPINSGETFEVDFHRPMIGYITLVSESSSDIRMTVGY